MDSVCGMANILTLPFSKLNTIIGCFLAGPSKAEVNCEDNHDGTCTVGYTPTKPGDYDITVKFAGEDIPGKYLL